MLQWHNEYKGSTSTEPFCRDPITVCLRYNMANIYSSFLEIATLRIFKHIKAFRKSRRLSVGG